MGQNTNQVIRGNRHSHMIAKILSQPRCIYFFIILVLSASLSAQTKGFSINADFFGDELTLSVGDKIKITYIDIGPQGNPIEKSSIADVRHDGTIFHELLGVVFVQNLTVKQVEELLTVKFSEFFTRPQVVVNIIEKTTIKVFLWGAVPRIGVYATKPATTIAEFIIQNGGASQDADISKITISRDDGSVVVFDLERYLFTNDASGNVELKNNDKIIVPRVQMKDEYNRLSKGYILQTGNVISITINELANVQKNPSQPENYIIDKEGNIFHRRFGLIRMGGITVDKAQATVTEMARRYYREPVVNIEVVELTSRSVFVFGEVNRAGIYPLEGNIRLAEFLANIGGLTRDADLKKITVTRDNAKTVEFNLEDYLFKRIDNKNIYLEDADRIIVLSKRRGLLFRIAEKIQPLTTMISLVTAVASVYVLTTRP